MKSDSIRVVMVTLYVDAAQSLFVLLYSRVGGRVVWFDMATSNAG